MITFNKFIAPERWENPLPLPPMDEASNLGRRRLLRAAVGITGIQPVFIGLRESAISTEAIGSHRTLPQPDNDRLSLLRLVVDQCHYQSRVLPGAQRSTFHHTSASSRRDFEKVATTMHLNTFYTEKAAKVTSDDGRTILSRMVAYARAYQEGPNLHVAPSLNMPDEKGVMYRCWNDVWPPLQVDTLYRQEFRPGHPADMRIAEADLIIRADWADNESSPVPSIDRFFDLDPQLVSN